MANTTLQYQSITILKHKSTPMSCGDSNSYVRFITISPSLFPTLYTPLSPSVLQWNRACHCSEQRNLVKYHSDNVVFSLSGAEYVGIQLHVSTAPPVGVRGRWDFRWSSLDTLCQPPHTAYLTYNSSELWHAINKHEIQIFFFWFFIRKLPN